jgi:acyl-coenzyme A thioesterase PaaI-like protein
MQLIGARFSRVGPGIVEIELDSRGDLTQQNGYVHAGIVTDDPRQCVRLRRSLH